jgi:3-hydroxybutyryl-CoA dehydrogenase
LKITKVAVIGAGSMGHQIAMLSALVGYETYLQDINEASLEKANHQLQARMEKWVKQGKITEEKKVQSFQNLKMTTNLKEAVQDVDLVIEAVVENLEVKQKVFSELDKLTPSHCILASNSSTIVNSKLAKVTNRPEKVCNMHYFFPPLVMDCIEVVRSERTSDETIDAVMDYCKGIGRTGVLLNKEIYGFIANRLLFDLMNEVYL